MRLLRASLYGDTTIYYFIILLQHFARSITHLFIKSCQQQTKIPRHVNII